MNNKDTMTLVSICVSKWKVRLFHCS